MNPRLALYLAVAAGSALGTLARVGIAYLWPAELDAIPWATLAVNAAGSFLIGIYAAFSAPGGSLSQRPVMRRFVMDGFCGGFTTFSLFSMEASRLAEQGHAGTAGLYTGVSIVVWLGCVWVGYMLARLSRGS